MKILYTFLVSLVLTGCVIYPPEGVKYSAIRSYLESEPDKARVIVYRYPNEKGLSVKGKIPIYIDDNQIGDCLYGGVLHKEIPPGVNTIKTNDNCALTMNFEKGKIYYFMAYPRADYQEATQNVGFVGALLAGPVGAAIGSLIAAGSESQGQTCRGMYAIVPVNKEKAQIELTELNLNE